MPWSHFKTSRPCKICRINREHYQQHRSPEHSWYLLVLNYCRGFMQPESRLTNFSIHVSVFLLWGTTAIWTFSIGSLAGLLCNSGFDRDMFGNLVEVEAFWNHLEPFGEPALASELSGCSLAREFSANATLKVDIYIGRMAVEDASCVVDDISVLCCWWHCSLQLALLMHCERQICNCKGDWSKENMNPWISMVDFDVAGRMRRSTSVAVRLDVPVILSTAQKG